MHVMTANAQLVDGAATVIVLMAPAYLVWGLVAPQSAMFWARRWSRLWTTGIAASLFMLGAGMGVYAQTGTPGLMIAFSGVAIWLIARTGTMPAKAPASHPAASPWAGPAVAPGAAPAQITAPAAMDAAIGAIRASVPPEQQSEFDTLYDLHKHSWSLLGKDQVAAQNIELAHRCVSQAARIWALKNAALPQIATTLSLPAGEQCVWKGDCARLAYVTVHGEVRQSDVSGGTRKVRVEDATHDELREVDDGSLYLTTKRLIFVGKKQNVFLEFGDIQTLVINDETDIAVGRAQGENLIYRSDAIKDPFDAKLTGPFEILWGRVRG